MIIVRSGTACCNLCPDLNRGHSAHLGSHLRMMHFWSLSIHACLSMSLQAVVILLSFPEKFRVELSYIHLSDLEFTADAFKCYKWS